MTPLLIRAQEERIGRGATGPTDTGTSKATCRKVRPRARNIMQTKIQGEPMKCTNARENLIGYLHQKTEDIVAPLRTRGQNVSARFHCREQGEPCYDLTFLNFAYLRLVLHLPAKAPYFLIAVHKVVYITRHSIYRSRYGGLYMLSDRIWKDGLFRWRRKARTESEHGENDFALELRINRHYESVSLDLQIANKTDVTAWVEEARVVLADLAVILQTTIPTGQARREIRQNVRANETLALDLARAIYYAAGKPLGTFSCLISVNVGYRIGDEWLDKTLDTYKMEMFGLKPRGLRRSR